MVASLSLVIDLDLGQPLEHVMRAALVAVRLGDAVGLNTSELADVYYFAPSTALAERDIDYHSVVVRDACTSAEIDNHIQLMQRVFPSTARVRTTDDMLERCCTGPPIGSHG